MARRPLIVGNWKMYKHRADAAAFCDGLRAGLPIEGVELAVCPPVTALDIVVSGLAGTGVLVFAQNGCAAAEGAFTGEVSMSMLVDAGVNGVLLGHSERRALFAETDLALAGKVPAAIDLGLIAVLCVGESERERDAGVTDQLLSRQLREGLAGIDATQATRGLVLAYEPVWAIGTGKTATPEIAQAAHAHIRAELRDLFGTAANDLHILYGGSVKPTNAADLIGQEDVDGALVGGASLDPDSMLAIASATLR